MDARLDPLQFLGLQSGDAHIVRNAGGRVSEDVIRSIVISQQLLGTRQLVIIHHTDCGLLNVTNDELRASLRPVLGPSVVAIDFLPLGDDIAASVRDDVRRLRTEPLLSSETDVQGYVFDVATGELQFVTDAVYKR
jgi:carbonic anhydrase